MNANAKIAIILLLVCGLMYMVWKPSVNNGPASGHLLVASTAQPPARTLSILFIGNSYTFVNDMPAMLVDIASSDPANTTAVQVKSVTRGGAHLIELWQAGAARRAIASDHWNYVVLQDQSEWAMLPQFVAMTHDGVEKLAADIRRAGAVPVIYETWQRQPGSQWYKDPRSSWLQNADYMKQMTHYQTWLLASQERIGVVPAGAAWEAVLDAKPGFPLYNPDGSHPSVTGTYLVALEFYHTLVKRDVSTVEFVPRGMDAADAAYLRGFVNAYVVR